MLGIEQETLIRIFSVLVSIVGVLMSLSHFFQAGRILKRKSADDVSFTFYGLMFGGSFIWLIYGLLIKDFPIIISFAIAILGTASVIGLMTYFRFNKKRWSPLTKYTFIEIEGGFSKNGREANYTVHYWGPDKKQKEDSDLCTTISIEAKFDYEIDKSYTFTKWIPSGKVTYQVKNYSKEKVEKRLHMIAKQFAKIIHRDLVPETFKKSVKIVDFSNYNLKLK